MSTFGQNVVKARVEKRWKQKDLQEATRLSQRYLSAVEHDKVDPVCPRCDALPEH